jgi:hypothetical protein
MAPEKSEDKPQRDIRGDVDPQELQEYIDNGMDPDGRYAELLKTLGSAATKNRL